MNAMCRDAMRNAHAGQSRRPYEPRWHHHGGIFAAGCSRVGPPLVAVPADTAGCCRQHQVGSVLLLTWSGIAGSFRCPVPAGAGATSTCMTWPAVWQTWTLLSSLGTGCTSTAMKNTLQQGKVGRQRFWPQASRGNGQAGTDVQKIRYSAKCIQCCISDSALQGALNVQAVAQQGKTPVLQPLGAQHLRQGCGSSSCAQL